MAGLPGSIQSLIPAGQDELVRRMRDLERRVDELGPSVARSFGPVLDDLTAKQATLTAQQAALDAQVAFLSSQSLGYASTKGWSTALISGTGAYQLLAYDPTYDDEYTFQASSTGVLEITMSARVMIYNASPTNPGATSRGYSLSWSGGSLPWSDERGAAIRGTDCGVLTISASNTSIVTVPSNATVTMQTLRAILTPIAPETMYHGVVTTTVVVTRIGI
jgi:hypothetical protein